MSDGETKGNAIIRPVTLYATARLINEAAKAIRANGCTRPYQLELPAKGILALDKILTEGATVRSQFEPNQHSVRG